MIRHGQLLSALRQATLVFLALPALIFFAGWLWLPLALPVCVSLGAAVWREMRRTQPGSGLDARVSLLKLAAVALPALALTLLSGAGGWGSGDGDWLKHDTLLRDLIDRPWPVVYRTAHGPVLLVYYLAFYLPAALVGKLAGFAAASQALALTTFLGTVLSALWLVALGWRGGTSCAPVWLGAAIFFGFSGLDVVGKGLVNVCLHLPVFYGDWNDIEWWAQFAQYSSNAATLFWAPQHGVGGWLPVALALDDWFADRDALAGRFLLYLALAAVWSPLAAVGLAGVMGGLLLWRGAREQRLAALWRRSLTLANAAGMLAGGCFALYLSAHFESYDLPEAYRTAPGRHPMPLLEQFHVPRPVLYLAFVGLEFAGLSAALWLFFRRGASAAERPVLGVATLVLLALPWFHYGFANDIVMRGGIPALFALQALLARMFAAAGGGAVRRGQRWAALLAAGLLLGGAANTWLEYRRHVVRVAAQGSLRDARTREPVRSLAELQRTVYARPGFDFTRQYLGAADGFYARHMGRSLPPKTPRDGVDF